MKQKLSSLKKIDRNYLKTSLPFLGKIIVWNVFFKKMFILLGIYINWYFPYGI